jgi:CRP-like cAMP-binding protein
MNQADRAKTCLPLLRSAPGFGTLPNAPLELIAGGSYSRTASRGQVLCRRGETPQGFHILVKGRVKLALLSTDGAERVLDVVLPGRTFGEAGAFLGAPCALHAEALMESRLVFVELPTLRTAISRWPQVADLMLRLLAQRAQRLTTDLEGCCLHSASQRVAALLLRDAVADPEVPDRASLELPAAKTVVASSLNLSAETFSRELHGLARSGLIEVERRTVRIPSLQHLRARGGLAEPGVSSV